jgi:hypothetical protein
MPISPLLIKALKAKKCVLIIGHDAVLQADNKTPIYQKALDEVTALFPDDVFYQQGDEFMYIPPQLSDDVYNNLAEIYVHTPAPIFGSVTECMLF